MAYLVPQWFKCTDPELKLITTTRTCLAVYTEGSVKKEPGYAPRVDLSCLQADYRTEKLSFEFVLKPAISAPDWNIDPVASRLIVYVRLDVFEVFKSVEQAVFGGLWEVSFCEM